MNVQNPTNLVDPHGKQSSNQVARMAQGAGVGPVGAISRDGGRFEGGYVESTPKTYTAKRLLEHGDLTMKEFIGITGWNAKTAYTTMAQLIRSGVVCFFYNNQMGQRRYRLETR